MKNYLTNRFPRCKIINSFSEWGKVLNGVPQGSISVTLFFNILLNDIFLSLRMCDLVNYADDSTLYTSDKSISNITNSLSHEFTILSIIFYNNFMILNPDTNLQTNLVCGRKILKTVNKKKY